VCVLAGPILQSFAVLHQWAIAHPWKLVVALSSSSSASAPRDGSSESFCPSFIGTLKKANPRSTLCTLHSWHHAVVLTF
jgi:hypothetical protein